MKLALGTTSNKKKTFVEEVFKDLKVPMEVESVGVQSGVSEQPICDEEVKKGSISRATNALNQSKTADLGLGIEIGYQLNKKGHYEMFCWASIVDKKGQIYSCQSHKLLLPEFHQNILKEKKYLGEYVREFLEKYPDPVSQKVGVIIRDRKPFIQTAVRSVLVNYLRKK